MNLSFSLGVDPTTIAGGESEFFVSAGGRVQVSVQQRARSRKLPAGSQERAGSTFDLGIFPSPDPLMSDVVSTDAGLVDLDAGILVEC